MKVAITHLGEDQVKGKWLTTSYNEMIIDAKEHTIIKSSFNKTKQYNAPKQT